MNSIRLSKLAKRYLPDNVGFLRGVASNVSETQILNIGIFKNATKFQHLSDLDAGKGRKNLDAGYLTFNVYS